MSIDDPWTAYCFDRAVSVLGINFENRTTDLDSNGHPKERLEDLLDDKPVNIVDMFLQMKGEGAVKVLKGKS